MTLLHHSVYVCVVFLCPLLAHDGDDADDDAGPGGAIRRLLLPASSCTSWGGEGRKGEGRATNYKRLHLLAAAPWDVAAFVPLRHTNAKFQHSHMLSLFCTVIFLTIIFFWTGLFFINLLGLSFHLRQPRSQWKPEVEVEVYALGGGGGGGGGGCFCLLPPFLRRPLSLRAGGRQGGTAGHFVTTGRTREHGFAESTILGRGWWSPERIGVSVNVQRSKGERFFSWTGATAKRGERADEGGGGWIQLCQSGEAKEREREKERKRGGGAKVCDDGEDENPSLFTFYLRWHNAICGPTFPPTDPYYHCLPRKILRHAYISTRRVEEQPLSIPSMHKERGGEMLSLLLLLLRGGGGGVFFKRGRGSSFVLLPPSFSRVV